MKTVSISRRGIVIGVGGGHGLNTTLHGGDAYRVLLYQPALNEMGLQHAPITDVLSGVVFDGDETQCYGCAEAEGCQIGTDTTIVERAVMYPMPPGAGMAQDQRSTTAQLEDLHSYAIRSRMYDAADWLKARMT